jgi:hypothetical protein
MHGWEPVTLVLIRFNPSEMRCKKDTNALLNLRWGYLGLGRVLDVDVTPNIMLSITREGQRSVSQSAYRSERPAELEQFAG